MAGFSEKWLSSLPQQFRDKHKIEVLIKAFADELEEVNAMFEQLRNERSMDTAIGAQLDGVGDIVVLNRAESALYAGIIDFEVIDDDRYRLFLKYKSLRNTNQCTFPELVEACKLLYNAEVVYYREDPLYPATFFLSIGARFDPSVLSILQSANLMIKPAGVAVKINYFDMKFFGFSDLNRFALGFGVGKFAQTV